MSLGDLVDRLLERCFRENLSRLISKSSLDPFLGFVITDEFNRSVLLESTTTHALPPIGIGELHWWFIHKRNVRLHHQRERIDKVTPTHLAIAMCTCIGLQAQWEFREVPSRCRVANDRVTSDPGKFQRDLTIGLFITTLSDQSIHLLRKHLQFVFPSEGCSKKLFLSSCGLLLLLEVQFA